MTFTLTYGDGVLTIAGLKMVDLAIPANKEIVSGIIANAAQFGYAIEISGFFPEYAERIFLGLYEHNLAAYAKLRGQDELALHDELALQEG